jgi:hypothetical protein
MAQKIGLQVPLDLSLESLISQPAKPAKVEEPTQASSPAPEVEEQPRQEQPKKVIKKKGSLTWKQTGFSLSQQTMTKLRLEAFKSGQTMSQVAESILSKNLPNHRIAS